VVKLLSSHPDFKDKPGLSADQRADRRFQIFNFLVQAGWMDAAEAELECIQCDFPDQKDKIATAAEGIKRLVALDRWDEVKLASDAGRHEAAQKLLAAFPADVDDQLQADVRALKGRYDNAGTDLKRAKQLLAELPARVAASEDRALFTEAASAIATELTWDHFLKKAANEEGRLDRFLSQADQAERLAKQDKSHAAPEELLSLAVTAWLLGPAAAETKPEVARRAWQARQLVRQYQKTADAGARRALLKAYEGKSGLGAAEMAQLIATLPPADPWGQVGGAAVALKTDGGRGTTYTLKLPPEYHPGRPYPVLIALHHAGEGGKDMMERWADHAAKYGYVLAAPEWGPGVSFYSYTPEEHATVLDTLRDLRRHLNVDSDRVFLTGYGEGGNMAYDVGLAHPDLFAGVIPVNGQPRFHARTYWPNALDLPFYVVWGERMGGPTEDKKSNGDLVNFTVFKDDWIPGAYPAMGVQYKGRGLEWFAAEVPSVFEWMALKRRRHPTERVGKITANFSPLGGEFRTMRPGDTRFYWLSVGGLSERCLNDARAWNSKATPALLAARVTGGNQIAVHTQGARQVSVWLARGMIDFDKPLTVRVNFQMRLNNGKVTPSLGTLLEDFYERGDRQQLYVARLDLNP
jgi:dienelactone hydrolase